MKVNPLGSGLWGDKFHFQRNYFMNWNKKQSPLSPLLTMPERALPISGCRPCPTIPNKSPPISTKFYQYFPQDISGKLQTHRRKSKLKPMTLQGLNDTDRHLILDNPSRKMCSEVLTNNIIHTWPIIL